MKKLIILISSLLIAGISYATDWQTALTADLAARNQGRSVTTDNSVILKVWATEGISANPGIGVSSNTGIIVYSNYVTGVGYTINPTAAATDTVGEIVDYINTNFSSDSSVRIYADEGQDAYRDMTAAPVLDANIIAAGANRDDSTAVVNSESSNRFSAGVASREGTTIRLKSISAQIPVSSETANSVALDVYDGNTRIWRKSTGTGALNSNTADAASPNSVILDGDKGLSATKGNSLCVVATSTANIGTDTVADNVLGLSIIYDQYKD